MIVANKNKVVEMANNLSESDSGAGRSLWRDARTRFIHNKAATVSLFVLISIVLFSFIGPYFAVWSNEQIDWNAMGIAAKVGMPSIESGHFFGTDDLGRDIYSRVIQGTQISLMVGVLGATVAVVVGTLYGATSGYLGGRVDQIMMRFADFVVALPFLLFMILFKIAFGIGPGESGIFPMLVALVILMWPATARLVRGQILQIREQGYIGASRLLGAKTNYLILRHMLPNTLGVVLVTITFAIPGAIFIEAFLSFIGMGVAPPTPSWGSMSNEGIKNMLTSPHELILPAILISITVLAFNLLGDGLRDALDARLRNQE